MFKIIKIPILITLAFEDFLGLFLSFLKTKKMYLNIKNMTNGATITAKGKVTLVAHVTAWKYSNQTISSDRINSPFHYFLPFITPKYT